MMINNNLAYRINITKQEDEFWTSNQRKMHPIHYTISYRASFKPELPEFFIRRYLNDKTKVVMDPFSGRGTTIIQANLMGYKAIHNDLSPVSYFIVKARQYIPEKEEFLNRLNQIDLKKNRKEPNLEEKERFYPFFHPDTYKELLNLREEYLNNPDDKILKYIMFIALSRLHGHSDGFFSVYSFPQFSVLPEAQKKNNLRRNIKIIYKDIKSRIIKKYLNDHKIEIPSEYKISNFNEYYQLDSQNLYMIPDNSVDLIITSPPFLDKVNYKQDNWLRAWFIGVEEELNDLALGIYNSLEEWKEFMKNSIKEMIRIIKPGGRIVIEVGEVKYKKNTIFLEDVIMDIINNYFNNVYVDEILINKQMFTKLSNCWKIENNIKGTNTNRCIVLKKYYHTYKINPVSFNKKIKLTRKLLNI
ncbi:MAG: DNA methylase [Leptospiraceae bacterium]|nr:MAG: DNA methylase [Leptospiraceae bacterium]